MSLALSGPLVSVADVVDALDDPALRVVDTRWYLGRPGDGRAAYDAGHLPGAIHLDVDTDLTASSGPGRHPLPEPAAFRARLAAVGIGDAHRVVAYDDVGGWVASRLWWMLDDLGHDAVAVLDGGIGAWTAAGQPLTTDEPTWPAASLSLRDDWSRVIDREALRASLGSVRLLDARAVARYRGEVEPIDAYAGHIPTAVSAPTDENLEADKRFLPPDQLAVQVPGPRGRRLARPGRRLLRERRGSNARRAGAPDRRAARRDALSGLVQRLDPAGMARRDRRRAR